jgi:hypothetical protein
VSHIIDGEFQSDKYPTTPRGKIPLSVKDPTAQDLLWTYAQRRRRVDAEFSDDLETALIAAGYLPIVGPDPIRDFAQRFIDESEAKSREVGVAGASTEIIREGVAWQLLALLDSMRARQA